MEWIRPLVMLPRKGEEVRVEDLAFVCNERTFGPHYHSVVIFPNGWGASVVYGEGLYGTGPRGDSYEVMLIRGSDNAEWELQLDDDWPKGWLSGMQVNEQLKEISLLEARS